MWNTIKSFLSSVLLKSLSDICSAVIAVFQYFLFVKKEEIKTKNEKKKEEQNKKIDEVCNNGSLNDLLNLGDK